MVLRGIFNKEGKAEFSDLSLQPSLVVYDAEWRLGGVDIASLRASVQKDFEAKVKTRSFSMGSSMEWNGRSGYWEQHGQTAVYHDPAKDDHKGMGQYPAAAGHSPVVVTDKIVGKEMADYYERRSEEYYALNSDDEPGVKGGK